MSSDNGKQSVMENFCDKLSCLYPTEFSLCRIDLRCLSKSTSICVETTLYQNKSKPLKSVPDSTADAMHFGVDTTWLTGYAKERFSFIHNWSANQRNYSTS